MPLQKNGRFRILIICFLGSILFFFGDRCLNFGMSTTFILSFSLSSSVFDAKLCIQFAKYTYSDSKLVHAKYRKKELIGEIPDFLTFVVCFFPNSM